MPDPLPPPSLTRAREQKISELSTHFANDDLSLDDLERRIERVYKAVTIADLELITADLRSAASLVDPRAESRRDVEPLHESPAGRAVVPMARARLVAFMSSTRRVGRWAVPRDLRFVAVMSDSKLDLTNAALPVGGVVNIELTAVMASVRIIVPPGMRVINDMHSVMADIGSSADEVDSGTAGASPVIRLTGTAFMSDMKVKVRRREEPIFDDED
jgi:hypothetical protein